MANIHEVAAQLQNGNPVEIELYGIGDGASMKGILKEGQFVTLTPVRSEEIEVGDVVFVRWRKGSYLLHLVKTVEGGRFLIANNRGKINGWVEAGDILAKATNIREP